MFPKGDYDVRFNIRVFEGEQLSMGGAFEIAYSRRCAATTGAHAYGLALDILVEAGATIKIIKNGQAVRSYGNQNETS